jgi:GLPGLI family protein
MKKFLTGVFVGTYLILSFSCGHHTDEKFISEGAIEFDAVVVDQDNPMASMAPSKMTIKFKNNISSAEMSAGMGLFTTSFISNPQTKTLTLLFKLLNKKYASVQTDQEIKKENDSYHFEITPTKETKIIAGYNCLKAHVKLKDNSAPDFDIYYTQDLDIQNPNFANPFNMVDGVLMEYQMKKFGLEMKFTAKSVKKDNIEDSSFELPSDYKKISQKEMDELFKGLQ